jgi:dihydrofolate reductase
MRKVVVFNFVSLDGFFADEDGNLDWQIVDGEFNKAAVEIIQAFDTILFGRMTYQLFERFWPNAANDPKISKEDRIIADRINEMKKIVFSKSLEKVTWNNSKLLKGDLEEEVKKLKQESGRDIVIYGSGTIVQQLTNMGLIDEYQLMLNPVILGKGKPHFKDIQDKHNLKFRTSKTFRSGLIKLDYETERIKE